MLRPIFWGVDHDADPPRLKVFLVGPPHRVVTFEIERGATRHETEIAALAELSRTPRAVLEAMAIPE